MLFSVREITKPQRKQVAVVAGHIGYVPTRIKKIKCVPTMPSSVFSFPSANVWP